MLTAVVFDFDGIIVDSEPIHFKSFNKVLKPLNLKISWEHYCESYIGLNDRDAFKEIFRNEEEKVSARQIKNLIQQKAEVFRTYIRQGKAAPLPGAVELIKSIPVRLPMALCSGALKTDVMSMIEYLGIEGCFNVIVTAEDTPKGKPDPAPYKFVIEQLGLDNPSAVLAIEDTPEGIASAKGAGLKVLAVTGHYGHEGLEKADAITDSLKKTTLITLENMVL